MSGNSFLGPLWLRRVCCEDFRSPWPKHGRANGGRGASHPFGLLPRSGNQRQTADCQVLHLDLRLNPRASPPLCSPPLRQSGGNREVSGGSAVIRILEWRSSRRGKGYREFKERERAQPVMGRIKYIWKKGEVRAEELCCGFKSALQDKKTSVLLAGLGVQSQFSWGSRAMNSSSPLESLTLKLFLYRMTRRVVRFGPFCKCWHRDDTESE